MKKRLVGLLAFLTLPVLVPLAGCAGYTVQPIKSPSEWPPEEKGYIIYEPVPYLKVVVQKDKDGKSEVATEIVYLPNYKHAYRVSTYAYLASANIDIAYKDGWMLTGVKSDVNTAEVAKAVLDLATAAVGAKTSAPGAEAKELVPGIYFFRLNDLDGELKMPDKPVISLPHK